MHVEGESLQKVGNIKVKEKGTIDHKTKRKGRKRVQKGISIGLMWVKISAMERKKIEHRRAQKE